jgi:Anp1/Glycosyltransferase sugar-binding region containing DXD motif
MIPKIIHQTWKDKVVPLEFADFHQSWRRLHPQWDFRFWNDDDLAAFVDLSFPEFSAIFHAYPRAIMRCDLGRYLILKRFGGVYADLDAEALAPFDQLTKSSVPVFAYEPESQSALEFVRRRGFRRIVSNAVMASPAEHPFWQHLLQLLRRCRSARSPLDATGPFLLTAAVETYPEARSSVAVLSAKAFSPVDKFGALVERSQTDCVPLAAHHWVGTWWKPQPGDTDLPLRRRPSFFGRLRKSVSKRLPFASRNDETSAARFLRSIDRAAIERTKAQGRRILIAIPVKNSAETLDRLFMQLMGVTCQLREVSLVFLDGGSKDGSLEKMILFARRHQNDFGRIEVITRHFRVSADEPVRDGMSRMRHSNMARVRNYLLRAALHDEDWVLWMEPDIVNIAPNTLCLLMATGALIALPNAVHAFGEGSADPRAWLTEREVSREAMAAFTSNGIYRPPAGYERLFLSDLRYFDQVVLDSAGPSMMLVHADLHRSGLIFPERPYRHLVDTEGFVVAARDLGIPSFGLPNMEVLRAAPHLSLREDASPVQMDIPAAGIGAIPRQQRSVS